MHFVSTVCNSSSSRNWTNLPSIFNRHGGVDLSVMSQRYYKQICLFVVFNYELFFYHKKSTRNPQQSCNKSTTFATCCTACSITNAEQIAQVDFDYNRKNLNALSIGRGTKEKSGWTWEHAPAGDQLPATNSQRDPTAESQWTSRDAIRFQRKVKAASLLICLVYNSVSYGYVNRSCLSIRLGLTV